MEAAPGQEPFLVVRNGPVAHVTFNRPDKRNALSWPMVRRLAEILADIESDAEIEIVVLAGEGQHFCAGGDLGSYIDLIQRPDDYRSYLLDFRRLVDGIEASPLIHVAVVRGYCVAGGLEILLACDLSIAGESARFSDGHLNFGQIPGGGSSQRLPRTIGIRRAKEMILTGRFVPAMEAERIGLINRCVADEQLDEAAGELLASIAGKSFTGRSEAKYLVNTGLAGPVGDGISLEIDHCARYETGHPDALEGLLAFRDKREPRFSPRRKQAN